MHIPTYIYICVYIYKHTYMYGRLYVWVQEIHLRCGLRSVTQSAIFQCWVLHFLLDG